MFHHHQEIAPTGRVRSVQTLDVQGFDAAPADAAEAGRLYWEFLRQFGRGLLKVATRPDGGVELRLAGLLLLAFGAPAIVAWEGGVAARYPIMEGAVVGKQGRNQGYLQVGLGRCRLSLAVEGYHAALVGPSRHPLRVGFYLATQSAIHVAVARGFLGLLARRYH